MPVLLQMDGPAGGRTLLPGMLMGTVAGLDLSDKPRTRCTLRLYCAIMQSVGQEKLRPLCADVLATAADCDAALSSCLQPWATEFVEKGLALMDHTVQPDKYNQSDHQLLCRTFRLFFRRIGGELFAGALQQVAVFLRSNLFAKAMSVVGRVVEELAAADPVRTLPVLMSIAAKVFGAASASDEEKLCMLRVVSKSTKRAGKAILPHLDFIRGILDDATLYSGECRKLVKECCKVAKCTIHGLIAVYPIPLAESQVGCTDYNFLGRYYDATTAQMAWHVPSADELAAAQKIFSLTVERDTQMLVQLSSADATFDKNQRWCVLKRLQNALRMWVLNWGNTSAVEEPQQPRVADGLSPLTRTQPSCGPSYLADAVAELHARMGIGLHNFVQYCSTHIPTELETHTLLCKTVGLWLIGYNDYGPSAVQTLRRQISSMKYVAVNPLAKTQRLHGWIEMRVELQHVHRTLGHHVSRPFTKTHLLLLDDLQGLAMHSFCSVRQKAQGSLDSALRCFPFKKQQVAHRLTEVLRRGVAIPSEESKGAVFTLLSSTLMERICRDYRLLSEFLTGVCEHLGHTRPSISSGLDSLLCAAAQRIVWPAISRTEQDVPVVPECLVSYLPSAATIACALKSNACKQAADVDNYNELIKHLDEMGAGDVHWKRKQISHSFLTAAAFADGEQLSVRLNARLVEALTQDDFVTRRVGVVAASNIVEMALGGLPLPSSPLLEPVDVRAALASASPSSQSEWDTTVWVDDTDFGWTAMVPAGAEVSLARCNTMGGDPLENIRKLGLGLLLDTSALGKILENGVNEHRGEELSSAGGTLAAVGQAFISCVFRGKGKLQGGFTAAQARMWQCFFKIGELPLFDLVEPLLGPLVYGESGPGIAGSAEKAKQAVVAEVLAGAVHAASDGWQLAQQRALWHKVEPVLAHVIHNASADVLADWEKFLQFCLARRDPRRLASLLAWLDGIVLTPETETKKCVAVLRLLAIVLRVYGWRLAHFAAAQLAKLDVLLAHPFRAVRVEVGMVLALATSAVPQDSASPLLAKIGTLCTSQAAADEEDQARQLTNARETMLWLASVVSSRSSLNSASDGAVLRESLMPLVIAAHADRDEDTRAQAFTCASAIALLELQPDRFKSMISMLSDLREKVPWRSRLGILPFLQALAFRHSLLGENGDRRSPL
jgi:hypothetical protein